MKINLLFMVFIFLIVVLSKPYEKVKKIVYNIFLQYSEKIRLYPAVVINSKKYVCLCLFGMCACVLCLMLYNYVVDPYDYFNNDYKRTWDRSQFFKVRYIKDNHDKYDCYIIGGSNSGVLSPELIKHYTGYETYSLCFAAGNGCSYYDYTKFLIENTDVKCIFLHLSSTEVLWSNELLESEEIWQIPSDVKGDFFGRLKEICSYLFKSIDFDNVKSHLTIKENGCINWSWAVEEYSKNPQKYISDYVIYDDTYMANNWGTAKINNVIVNENLEYMSSIKQLCDENDVELTVIMGPVFTAKRIDFECSDYYGYLERLVDIVDVWDFSGFTTINNNPHNFYDRTHYGEDVSDEMIRYIYGESYVEQEFGVLLTKDTIFEYMQERREDFNEMQQELLDTGTIVYGNYEDDSRIKSLD